MIILLIKLELFNYNLYKILAVFREAFKFILNIFKNSPNTSDILSSNTKILLYVRACSVSKLCHASPVFTLQLIFLFRTCFLKFYLSKHVSLFLALQFSYQPSKIKNKKKTKKIYTKITAHTIY